MRQRNVGATGEVVGAIGLGGLALSSTYHPTDDENALALMHRAFDIGVTHLDTADAYGKGHNERLFGKAIESRRDSIYLATKFGQLFTPEGKRIVNGRPEYVVAACDASLERLGCDSIDLYYLHRVDPDVPIEETVGAMAGLVSAGKVRHIGLTEAAPATVRRAHATHPLAAIQVEYSLWTRFPEDELLGLCDEFDIGFVAYSPLGRGFLSGTIKDVGDLSEGDRRLDHPRFSGESIGKNVELLQALQDVAVAHGVAPAQVALAWVLASSERILPIPSTSTIAHLEENVAAAEIELAADEIETLGAVFAADAVAGDRYPPAALKKVQL
jgi:aryl-alcohol dehydrogenase-like predicted oxidoreductase